MAKNERLAKVINEVKLRENLTQSEIAQMIEVTNTYFSDVINGRVSLSDKLAGKISELFHINKDYLFAESDEMLKDSTNNTNPINDDAMTITLLTKMLFDSQARVKELETEIKDLREENSMLRYGTDKKESRVG